MKTNEIPPTQQMFQHITAYWVTQLMAAAARLGVADQLDSGPLQVNELAGKVGAHPQALYRALRACTAVGVFTEQPGQIFANNPLSQTLRSNVPGSMRDFAIAQAAPGHWRPWELLTQVVKTGKSSARAALGCELWDWYGSHAEESAAFSGAMDNLAAQVAAEVTRAIDFSGVGRVVDVGGASGTLVTAVLRTFPQTKGVLLDLAHVVGPVKKTLVAIGLYGALVPRVTNCMCHDMSSVASTMRLRKWDAFSGARGRRGRALTVTPRLTDSVRDQLVRFSEARFSSIAGND